MKLEKENNQKFFDKVADYYDSGLMKYFLTKIQKKVIKNINIKNNSKILDAGCGTGNFLGLLSKNETLDLGGIDISDKMLKIAKKKLGNKTKLRILSVEDLREKKQYDYIFSTEAFHHFYNQKKAMKNFYSALKKRGKLIVVDIDFGRFFNWMFHIFEPGNTKMNSKKDFYEMFEDTGFQDIQQKRVGLIAVMTFGVRQ